MTTRQYLRFCPSSIFGVIASSTARISHFNVHQNFNSVVVPACENVTVWNLKTKEKSLTLLGESSYVTSISCDPNGKHVAVGYADGFVRIFDARDGSCVVCFCGHKSGVSCLAFENGGLNLASGGKDSEIVVWNVADQAGLFRLKGHKGPITKCLFLTQRNILISGSKDTFIKFWDLDTQHCFQTLVGNRYEVLDFIVIKDTRLITGINGPDLKVWDLFLLEEDDLEGNEGSKKLKLDLSTNGDSEFKAGAEESTDQEDKFRYKEVGKLLTAGDRTSCLIVDKSERILGCHASTKILQLYKILNPEEISKRFRKRKRKENRKNKDNSTEDDLVASNSEPSFADEFLALHSIQTRGKLDSFAITVLGDIAKIAVLLKNNSIYQYELDISSKNNDAILVHSIVLPGHRSMVKSLSYSQDNQFVLSLSEESVKIWKRFKEQEVCTQTLSCESALCSVFVPGNTHCIIGTKNGTLDIYEISSQQLLERKLCHDASVTCLCLSPEQSCVTSGGRDKNVKFWDFELVQDEDYSTTKKRLSLTLKRTLQMPDEILCLCYSPDMQRIAISLLDNTVQVLFVDSLKLVFSLYGHALPVTCMDISYDSTLIATGSEDKDLRIWSMEFGNCNKFIKKAHDKGITCLYFLPKTHMFFTGSRDNTVKQWDADNFQKIITLKGHQNEVNAMAVSPDGISVVTASKDRSIRVWEKTSEPLVLEEEQEKERDEENEVEDLAVVPGEVNKEVSLPGIKTEETIKTVDQLIEAIDVYLQELKKLEEYKLDCQRSGKELPVPAPHPLLVAHSANTPIHYMCKVVKRIKSSELEGTLLYLPFNYVLEFLKILCEFVERGWEIELCERCSSFLVRIHMGQIISAQNFLPVIEKLRDQMFSQVYQTRDMIGFVKTACQLHQRAIDAIQEVPMFTSVLDGLQQKKRKAKRRSIVAFT